MVPSEKGDRNPPEGCGLPYSLPTPAPLTSLSSLATSFRSPRTNSRSSTMILICSFTLVLEAAGGPSAAEDEEGFPLDLADILRWGTSEPGQDRRASRGCCAPGSLALLRPLPPQSPHISAARRAAAGGCAVRSAGRPHCGAAINSPRRGARRRAADGRAARLRLLPPPPAARSRAHSRVERGCAAPPGVSAAPPQAHPARVSLRPFWRRGAGRQVRELSTLLTSSFQKVPIKAACSCLSSSSLSRPLQLSPPAKTWFRS